MNAIDELKPGDEVELMTGRGPAYGRFTGIRTCGDTRLVGMFLANGLGEVEFAEDFVHAYRKCRVVWPVPE